jgi:hypothetical protein
LKALQQNVPVVNLGELAKAHREFVVRSSVSRNLGSPTPSKRARSSSDSLWEVVTAFSDATSSKQTSIAIANDFSQTDSRLNQILVEIFVKNRWRVDKGAASYNKGYRPMSADEIKARCVMHGGVESHLMKLDPSGDCWKHYEHLTKTPERRTIGTPILWPRTERVRMDDAVKERKELMFSELTRVVHIHLGEFTDGPPDRKRLSLYLHETFLILTNMANAPVNEWCHTINPDQRNSYLTKLLPDWTWQGTKDVVMGIWYELEGVEWMKNSFSVLHEEVKFLDAMIEQESNA